MIIHIEAPVKLHTGDQLLFILIFVMSMVELRNERGIRYHYMAHTQKRSVVHRATDSFFYVLYFPSQCFSCTRVLYGWMASLVSVGKFHIRIMTSKEIKYTLSIFFGII